VWAYERVGVWATRTNDFKGGDVTGECEVESPGSGSRPMMFELLRESYRTLRDGSLGVALSQALRARLRSHCPSGTFRNNH
jgi:hypothetical protein